VVCSLVMLGSAIALGSVSIGRVELQLFRSPVAIAVYVVLAVILLWPLSNRFLVRQGRRRPAHEVHPGPAHALVELAEEVAGDSAHLPEVVPVFAPTNARAGPTTATTALQGHPATAGASELTGRVTG
jgi:hypothetical protein